MNDLIFEWAPNEKIFSLGPIGIHWYSLMFLLAFYIGFQILKKIYIKEGKNVALLDPFLVHMVLGTIIGARISTLIISFPLNLYRPSARPAGTPTNTAIKVTIVEIIIVKQRLSKIPDVSDKAYCHADNVHCLGKI